MPLRAHEWDSVYRSGEHNLITDFYQPALEKAVRYDRAVGYFSADILMSNLKGIASLVKNNGKMRLIIGHPLKDDEYKALKHGINTYRFLLDIEERLQQVLREAEKTKNGTLKLFAYLVASERIEIKYAFRRIGMYHEKIGIIEDSYGNKLVFQGSANETVYGLSEGYNAESFSVYPSWESVFDKYGQRFLQAFDNLWNNKQINTVVVDMPTEQYEKIISYTDARNLDPNNIEPDADLYDEFFQDDTTPNPRLPSFISQRKFELMEHQKQAIKQWWSASQPLKGILELATGSGKTITAISAATLLFQEVQKKKRKLALLISVPYIELAQQWVENLNLFNIYPVECWGDSNTWSSSLRDAINRFNIGAIDFFAAVVVNRTLIGDRFQHIIANLDTSEVMLIGDECHHFGGEQISKLAPKASFRMGLSATPFRGDDDDYDSPFPDIAKERIIGYFKEIVATYTLEDAIKDGVLCNYNYHIVEVYLTEEEQEEYDALSSEIAKLVAIELSNGLSHSQKSRLSILTGQRSMLLGSAENKYHALQKIIKDTPKDKRPLSLFYCGAGHDKTKVNSNHDSELIKVIDRVSKTLSDNGWTSSQFTSRETAKERESRMNDFVNKHIDALVTIRVLDEGVDVPACKTAYLLASTKNERQYIQRRGRVLRKSEGKDTAEIYDFVTLPNPYMYSPFSNNLKKSELKRINDFCSLALNKEKVLRKIDEVGLNDMGFK